MPDGAVNWIGQPSGQPGGRGTAGPTIFEGCKLARFSSSCFKGCSESSEVRTATRHARHGKQSRLNKRHEIPACGMFVHNANSRPAGVVEDAKRREKLEVRSVNGSALVCYNDSLH
jgi:hypothetical protein